MQDNKDILKRAFPEITDFQIDLLIRQITDFKQINLEINEYVPQTCPICGYHEPRTIKRGKTKGGKQIIMCKECKKRFVHDHGQLTFYSHQSADKWNILISDTIEGTSLKKSAAKLDVFTVTAFNMRHKLLNAIEKSLDSTQLAGTIELDETYVLESHKGLKMNDVTPRKRGSAATKRGLSNENVCIITGIDRDSNGYAKCVNKGKPGSLDILNAMSDHITHKSELLFDGLASYGELVKKKQCSKRVLKDYNKYDLVHHLNTTNSFHSLIKFRYEKYRGVASKYINRYSALFIWIREFLDMDSQEYLTLIYKRLRVQSIYFSVNDIKTRNLVTYSS